MKSEPDAFSIDDLARVGTRALDRRAQLPGAQFHAAACRSATACCSTTPTPRCPASSALAEVASDAYPDPTQFEQKSDYFDPEEPRREEPRWSLVDVALQAQAQAHRSRWKKCARHAERSGRLRAAPPRQPAVGAAGDGGAMENHPLPRIGTGSPCPRTKASDCPAKKPLEYVEDGSIVGVGTGSTVAFFIDALGRMKHRIEGAVSSSEQSTRAAAANSASRCSTSTPPARWRCTSTAPTSAIRTSA